MRVPAAALCLSLALAPLQALAEAPASQAPPPIGPAAAQQVVHGGGGRQGTVVPIPVGEISAERITLGNGRSAWRVKIPGGRALATPAVAGGMVFVGGGFGSHEFYAFDAETGKPRWGIQVSDDGPTAAVVAEGYVLFNTESCTLFVVEARTGKHVWSRWLGDPLMSQPAVSKGVVYIAYPGPGGHRLAAFALRDGRPLWEAPIAGDVISAPVVEGDSVYSATNDGTVYRHRAADGKVLFEKKMQATSAPAIAAGELRVSQGVTRADGRKGEGLRGLDLVGNERTPLLAERDADYLDARVQAGSGYAAEQRSDDSSVGFSSAPATAKVSEAAGNLGQASVRGLWEFQGSRPLILGGRSFASQGDALRCVGEEGKVAWERKVGGDAKAIGGHLATPPAFAAGKLVVATATGAVLGYAARDGAQAFRFEVGEEIRFQPALAKGRIFVGTARGSLVSIASGDASLDGWTMWGGGPSHNGPEGG
jgi:Ca-activated chloride channel family protein